MFLEQYEIWLARDALSLASDLSIECIAPNSRPSLIGWQDVGHHAFFSWQYQMCKLPALEAPPGTSGQ